MWDSLTSFLSDKAGITAIVTLLLWIVTRWWELGVALARRRRDRASLIRSLFAEVDFNTRDLDFFVKNSAALDAIAARLRQGDSYRPHVTDAHHTIIYQSRISDLHFLENGLTARLVLFYGLLDKIKAQIDGINQTSYGLISAEGRISVVRQILANVTECRDEGEAILDLFSKTYPAFSLTRHARRLVDVRQS